MRLLLCETVPRVPRLGPRRIEPDTPPPRRRLQALARLAAAEHSARFLTVGVLRLQGSVRSVYGGFLRREVPELLALCCRLYPDAYAPLRYQEKIYARVAELKELYGFKDNSAPMAAAAGASAPTGGRTSCRGQLTLF